jgi:hypothetical protein
MAALANAVTASRSGFGAAGPALFSGHARGRSGFCAKTLAQTGQDIVMSAVACGALMGRRSRRAA